jgi:hypothetical protein
MCQQSVRWSCVLAVVMLLLGSAGSLRAAAHTPQDRTPVVVVEDQTAASGCLQWVDSSANARPCPAGSLLVSRQTTFAEVRHAHIRSYAVLMGDPQRDAQLARQLADALHRQTAGPAGPQMIAGDCGAASYAKTIGGSYRVGIDGGLIRVFYQVRYTVMPSCAVVNASDRAYVTPVPRVQWTQTVTGGCWLNRNIWLNTSYTSWQAVPSVCYMSVGKEYDHYAWDLGYTYYGYTYYSA